MVYISAYRPFIDGSVQIFLLYMLSLHDRDLYFGSRATLWSWTFKIFKLVKAFNEGTFYIAGTKVSTDEKYLQPVFSQLHKATLATQAVTLRDLFLKKKVHMISTKSSFNHTKNLVIYLYLSRLRRASVGALHRLRGVLR